MRHVRTFIVLVLGALVCALPASAQVQYQVLIIEPPAGALLILGKDMSNSGRVIGIMQVGTGSEAKLSGWSATPAVGTVLLPPPPGLESWSPVAINDAGDIAGDGGYESGIMWRRDATSGRYEFLGALPGHDMSFAADINELAQVAGTSFPVASPVLSTAVVSTPGQPLLPLVAGAAQAINEAGLVVGNSSAGGVWQVWVHTPGVGTEFLPPLPGNPYSWARSMNDAGDIVGEAAATLGKGDRVPWIHTPAGGIQKIVGFGAHATAGSINNARVVVGSSGDIVQKAWIWSAVEGLRFLDDLIAPEAQLKLRFAIRITDHGEILCQADSAVSSDRFVVVLTPIALTFAQFGPALPGAGGVPLLTGTGSLAPQTFLQLSLVRAAPLASTTLLAGASLLNTAFKGGVLVPTPTLVLPGVTTDSHGAWLLKARWPAGMPHGAELFVQAWIPDIAGPEGFAASNGLKLQAP